MVDVGSYTDATGGRFDAQTERALMRYSSAASDDLPLVMAEVKAALGAVGTTLTQYPSDGSATEVIFHDDATVDHGALGSLTALATRPTHNHDSFGWSSCASPTQKWEVLSFPVHPVPGHAQLTISAYFATADSDWRNVAETAYLSRRPFAVGYFRLWQLNRVRARQSLALEEALSLSNTGVIFVNRARQVVYANAAGESLLTEAKSISRNGDATLSAVKMAESMRLQVALSHVIDVDHGAAAKVAPIMSLRRNNGEALILSVLPTSQVGTEPTDIGAIVYIHDPFVSTDRLMFPLCRLFGLTPTETRLASLLVAGTPLPECAAMMRVAQQTARGYLKQLFQKTGTRRQIDLVRLMLISLMHIDPAIEVEAI